MFNNFSLSRVDPLKTGTESSENIVMVHTSDDPPPLNTLADSGDVRWRVRRRSSTELVKTDSAAPEMSSLPRLSRTNSVFYDGAEESDTDSCFSETSDMTDESEMTESSGTLKRRHSVPSLHSMADLDMVKFLLQRPQSSLGQENNNDQVVLCQPTKIEDS